VVGRYLETVLHPKPAPEPDFDIEVMEEVRATQHQEAVRVEAVRVAEGAKRLAEQQAPVAVPVQPPQPATVQQVIVKWANHYGVSADLLLRIARCESGFNPFARNTGYADPLGGNPVGLFQHLEGYWPVRAAKYGVPGASIYDVEAQARVTAGMFADGQAGQWECR
jgi:hypothetical protein